MAVNMTPARVDIHKSLMSKFPKETHEKLSRYTTEELFYLFMVYYFKPGHEMTSAKAGMLALKSKLFRFLSGVERDRFNPVFIAAVAKRWHWGEKWMGFLAMINIDTGEAEKTLAAHFNNQRTA